MYVLPESKWYMGELIEEITVAGEPRNVVHRKVTLVYAHSPEEAYHKALALSTEIDIPPEDSARKLVHTKFWGLAELNVVQDDPKPGAAVFYEEQFGVPGEKVHHWVLPRKDLISRHPLDTKSVPNFSAYPRLDVGAHARKPSSDQ